MCCFMQTLLAKTLADFEVQLEKEVLEPLNKLSEVTSPRIPLTAYLCLELPH